MVVSGTDIIDDLEAELNELEGVLAALAPDDWMRPSAAAGWAVVDVVLHLAQTDEAVPATLHGEPWATDWRRYGKHVDEAMAAMVRAEPAEPAEIFQRWRTARRDSVAALRAADPREPVRWVTSSLKPPTLATTRPIRFFVTSARIRNVRCAGSRSSVHSEHSSSRRRAAS